MMARMKPGTIRLFEYVTSSAGLQVDEEAGCLRGVRILGLKSANGREYLKEAVGAAVPLYQGRPVYVNHRAAGSKSRLAEDKVGWLGDVRQATDGGLNGTLHLLKSHPMTARIFEAARRNPSLFGLSHDAAGRPRQGSNDRVIEALETVHSVDIVADPATCSGLNESRGNPVKKTRRQRLMEAVAGKPALRKWLEDYPGAMDMDQPEEGVPGAAGDMAPPMPDAASDGPGHGQELLDAVAAMLQPKLDEAEQNGETFNPKYMKRLRKILDLCGSEGEGDEGEGDEAPASGADEGTTESRRPRQPRPGEKALQEELTVTGAVMDAGLTFKSPAARVAFVKSLVPLTESERKELIEERRAAGNPAKGPRSQSPGQTRVTEGRSNDKPPADAKDAARRWR